MFRRTYPLWAAPRLVQNGRAAHFSVSPEQGLAGLPAERLRRLLPWIKPGVAVIASDSATMYLTTERVALNRRKCACCMAGKVRIDGDRKGFDQLRGILVPFTPDFEIGAGHGAEEADTGTQALRSA